MGHAKCSDAAFIEQWKKYPSVAQMSRLLGTPSRCIQSRRRRLEVRYGLRLLARASNSPDVILNIPQNAVRVTTALDDGIVIVGSDAHYANTYVSTAHRAFVMIIKALQPKIVIYNGDVIDGGSTSRHGRIGWDKQTTVKQEYDAAQERTGEVAEAGGDAKRIWTMGNHCIRPDTWLSAHAAQFEGVKGFALSDHFPLWQFCMSVFINGHTMIKHRYHGGVHCTWNNILKAGTSMVCGHTHSQKVTPFNDLTPHTKYGVDLGMLAAVEGEQFRYAEDNPKNHRSGFAVLTFRKGVLMPPELVQVIDEDEGLVNFRGSTFNV